VIRSIRLLAVSATAALVLTGCGDGTVRTGAAATVGDDRITTTALDELVTRGLASPIAQQSIGDNTAELQRSSLARLIERVLLTVAADKEGVTLDGAAIDREIDNYRAQAGGEQQLEEAAAKVGIARSDLRQVIADFALRDAIADKLTASIQIPASALQEAYQANIAQFDQVRSAHILVATKALADQILAQVKADPGQFAALAAKHSSDTSNKDNGGDLGLQGRGALEKPFEDAIFGNKPGSFVTAKTSFGFHVIHVIERKTTTFEQATVQLRRNLLDQQRQQAILEYLVSLGDDLGVHVNPRFGTWDASTQSVVAKPDCPGTALSLPSPRAEATAAPDEAPTPTPSC
jgi:parvulin-like peptidyl-prolyl isomerase